MDKEKFKELETSYKFVFASNDGKKVLQHIIKTTGVKGLSYDPEGRPENTFYNEGRRSIGIMVLKMTNTLTEE